MAERYRTIVADPPWAYDEGFALGHGRTVTKGKVSYEAAVDTRPLPYAAMSVDGIAALPVAALADCDARLFLWTTNRYIEQAFGVLAAWGFAYKQTLVWHKTDVNLPGHVAPNSAEFILVGTVGKPARPNLMPSAVIATTRLGGPGTPSHSQKRECWLDYFEQVSPGPYVELFARRARMGWDYWGDQSLGTAEMPDAA
jgi:N6-adenosine-specific RNA methylase IME4